jgi:hypothetical protein
MQVNNMSLACKFQKLLVHKKAQVYNKKQNNSKTIN